MWLPKLRFEEEVSLPYGYSSSQADLQQEFARLTIAIFFNTSYCKIKQGTVRFAGAGTVWGFEKVVIVT